MGTGKERVRSGLSRVGGIASTRKTEERDNFKFAR